MRLRARAISSVAGFGSPRCCAEKSIRRIVSLSYSSGTLNARASAAYVMSSGVGPMPPLVMTQSVVRDW